MMRKRIFVAFAMACLAVSVSAQSYSKSVKAIAGAYEDGNDSQEQEKMIVSTNFCNIVVYYDKYASKDDKIGIDIHIESKLVDGEYLMLFNQQYSDSDLKWNKNSVRRGKNRKMPIETYSIDDLHDSFDYRVVARNSNDPEGVYGWSRGYDFVLLYKNSSLHKTFLKKDNTINLHLPVYKAKERLLSSRVKIVDMEMINITISANVLESQTYKMFLDSYNNIRKSLEGKQFCNNPHHTPSLEEQIKPYRDAIDDLNVKIENVKTKFISSDSGWGLYDKLQQDLVMIDLSEYEYDCGKHGHSCKWCSMSYDKMAQRLEDLYTQVQISDNPTEYRAKIRKEVRSMHNCYVEKKNRKGDSRRREQIENFFRRLLR